MADVSADEVETSPKKSKLGLIVSFLLMIAGGAGGFFVVNMGLFDNFSMSAHGGHHADSTDLGIEFVSLDPVTVSLVGSDYIEQLRFNVKLEVNPEKKSEVEYLIPRIVDIMNGYLRVLKPEDFKDSIALLRIRSQLLRRFQLVAGRDAVHDVLIMEFVLN